MGGPHHHVAGSIQDDALPRPLVQEQHLALTRHHILASQGSKQSVAAEISRPTSLKAVIGHTQPHIRPANSPSLSAHAKIGGRNPQQKAAA